jgi:hypothetical protein
MFTFIDYLKAAYDELTDKGENYIPEMHDHMVDEMAAQRFGITESQANPRKIWNNTNK